MRGSCSPENISTIRLAPIRLFIVTPPDLSAETEPMHAAAGVDGVAIHHVDRSVGFVSWDKRNKSSFVGKIHRVKAQYLARSSNVFADCDTFFLDVDLKARMLPRSRQARLPGRPASGREGNGL